MFLSSSETPLKQYSDHVTFNCHGSQSSYLIHSSAFSFIIKPSSIILLIYTLSRACAGAINISSVFYLCVYAYVCVYAKKGNLMCLCASSCVAAIKIKTLVCSMCIFECEHAYVRGSRGKSVYYIYQWCGAQWRVQISHTPFLLYSRSHKLSNTHINTLIYKVISTWENCLKSVCWVQSYCIRLFARRAS